MNLTSEHIKRLITDKAKELGFIKVGFAKAEVLDKESEQLRYWLDDRFAADMEWIERGYDKRKDIKLIMPEAKSVISLAHSYYTPFQHGNDNPKISRYAWGKDYHKVLKKKLKELCGIIETTGAVTRAYVDDGPVMDKAWAVKAGIGWQGKHTNIINPEFGSFFFLCEIITDIEFENYDSPIEDLCGSCSLCIDACPTGAITEDYKVNANRCISYQTIENRGEIPNEINLNGWVFGCDICQDVCPFNQSPVETTDKDFYPKDELYNGKFKDEEQLKQITEEEFNNIFSNSPIMRTKFTGWKRNLERFSND